MGIYVETRVQAPLNALWTRTQTPALHEQWDLRFSRIEYLPKASEDDPQRFRYTTRIGFGLEVSGDGESVAMRHLADGSGVSALRFASADSRSIIREGSGYWKYIPTANGVRFLTWYDYRTRFGAIGRLFDRVVFRPLLGWATAWSFDRLRLWLEHGIDPGQALRQTQIHVIVRIALAVILAYQGLVPKLIGAHADELAMLADVGEPAGDTGLALAGLGAAELALALGLLVAWRARGPLVVVLVAMGLATMVVGLQSPRFFGAAFNPLTLNVGVAALAAIDLLTLGHLPSAARCRRRPLEEDR
jgi:hypothetical protein